MSRRGMSNGRAPARTTVKAVRRTSAAMALSTAAVSAASAAGLPLLQLNHFETGFDDFGVPLLIPAIDPAGIAWHAPSGHLFIADSEINEVAEVFALVGANIFEVSPAGDVLYASYDLTAIGNDEPTGITYNEFDGFFYVSNDDDREVTRYSFSPGAGFAVDDVVDTLDTAGLGDPEGITSDPGTGLIYVVDGGAESVAVYQHLDGFELVDVLDLVAINGSADVPDDPEGIAFDPCTGTLLIVSDPEERIYEFTTDGVFLGRYDLSALSPGVVAPQGLTVGPTSDPDDDPLQRAIYIADGGIDNNEDPLERDGAVYEADGECAEIVNSPPVIDPVADQVVDEETELLVLCTASDPDPGDTLTFTLTGQVPGGADIDPITGLFAWTPSEPQGPGDYDITVRATDDGIPPLFDETTFTVSVNETNAAPAIDPITDQTIREGMKLSLVATASDPDPADTLTFSLTGTVPDGAAIDAVSGLFTWTPSPGQGPATYPINVRVTDDGSPPLFDETVFMVTVTEAGNSSPVLDPIPDQTVDELTELSFLATASDPDPEDTLTFSLTGSVPAGAAIDPLTGLFTWTPSEDQGPGTYDLTVHVTDDGEPPLFDEESFTVTVDEDNHAPVIDPIADQMVDELVELSLVATAFDPDPGQTLAFSLTGTVPEGAAIDAVTGLFTWTPSESQGPGTYTVTVRATDDGVPAMFDETSFMVTVNEINSPPMIGQIADQMVDELTELSLVASAFDPDPGQTIAFTLEGSVPAGAAIDVVTGLFTWTPSESQGPGTYQLTVRATDDGVPPMFDETAFMVTVLEVNDPPVLDPIGDLSGRINELITFTATATDPDASGGTLVAHWPFDTDFSSTTGNHDGTAVNGAAITGAPGDWVLGNGALALDGVDDYVDVGEIPLSGSLTAAAWILPHNIGSGGTSDAVVFGDLDYNDSVRVELEAVRLHFSGEAVALATDPDFVNGSWQHLLVVRSGTAVAAYRNGEPVAAGSVGAPFTPALLGHQRENFYEGLLDDVAVWDRALTPEEIAYLYDGGSGNPAGDIGAAGTLTFTLEGDVPPGATIDAATGEFSWQAPAMPVSHTFTVRVTDDGVPPLFDEEEITITVIVNCVEDLDGDGQVGTGDLLALLEAWNTDPGGPPDFDQDGTVSTPDLLVLLSSWGPCGPPP